MGKQSRRNRQQTGKTARKYVNDYIKDEDREDFSYYFEFGVALTKKIKELKPLADNRPTTIKTSSIEERRTTYKKLCIIHLYDFSNLALEEVESILTALDKRNTYSKEEIQLFKNDFDRYSLLSIVYKYLSNSNYIKAREFLVKYKEVSSKNLDIMLFGEDNIYKDLVCVDDDTNHTTSFGSSECVRRLGEEQMDHNKCLKECWEAIFQEEMP